MNDQELFDFTKMTCDLILAIRECPQIIISAIDGVCVGAGAAIALASDIRIGTEQSKVGFIFARVGLAGCDMGACSLLPRIIGQGRTTELLLNGAMMNAQDAYNWGFYNKIVAPQELMDHALDQATQLASGPTLAHRMTKQMLNREWNMSIPQALEAEAKAQARCMKTNDFRRAYEAFVKKEKPVFKGD